MELLLPELCFPGRQTVMAAEIAAKCGISERQVHLLVEDPDCCLMAIDIGRRARGAYRIPVTSYYAWIASIATQQPAENPILNLDTPVLIKLFREIAARLELRGEIPIHIIHQTKP
jgi:hypothetical protein